jgi:hypothetical protein
LLDVFGSGCAGLHRNSRNSSRAAMKYSFPQDSKRPQDWP